MSTNAVVDAVQARAEAVQAFILHHVTDTRVFATPFGELPLPWPLSQHGLMVLLAFTIIVASFLVAVRRHATVPHGLANLLEFFVAFVRNQIAIPHLGGESGRRLTPLLCSFFFLILVMNLVGLCPGLGAATGNLSVTAALASITFGFMVLGAIVQNGPVGFIKGFIPHGVPWPILLLLVPIEMFGLLIKCMALTVRLFANILAGHFVVFFLLGLLTIFGVAAAPFFGVAILCYIMDVFVAFLQAYVFTMLSAIFIGQRLHPEH